MVLQFIKDVYRRPGAVPAWDDIAESGADLFHGAPLFADLCQADGKNKGTAADSGSI